MARVSNGLVATLNVISLLLSVPILGTGIWLSSKSSASVCEKFLADPVIAIGAVLLVISIAGLLGSCCRITWLLWVYLFAMFLLIVLMICFTIFAFVVTNRGAGEVVSGRGYKEYKLGDYSHWLQRRVNNPKNWVKIRSCLQETKVCRTLQEKNHTLREFLNDINLSPLESGCCKPPASCNFTYISDTVWEKPAGFSKNSSIGRSTGDCNAWDSEQGRLCFDCQSCKAGVLANLRSDWKKVAIVNIVALVFLGAVYCCGCCAFSNNREDNARPYRWKAYP
ncbi:uncharacterized protein A4U43_C01F710 [Asparagus officinalis]|uniref:Uncharacterized protein n=1 Tax=Asparagus officinalis TaxID=4686 RepID=A0A5P1FQA5_ASPOF|nr:tetraspanin-8-like [Asparagus officinalis]ONK78891.1 uncharacterized protein A4U43_C01F710 [Asparagus officinalis]